MAALTRLFFWTKIVLILDAKGATVMQAFSFLIHPFEPTHFLIAFPLWALASLTAGFLIESAANLFYELMFGNRAAAIRGPVDFLEKLWRAVVGFAMAGAVGSFLIVTIAAPIPPGKPFGWPEAAAFLCGLNVFFCFSLAFVYAPSFRQYIADWRHERAMRPRVWLPRPDREALKAVQARRKAGSKY